jgi:hypothetical protein
MPNGAPIFRGFDPLLIKELRGQGNSDWLHICSIALRVVAISSYREQGVVSTACANDLPE